ncbi:MAG: hypothetical protein HY060_05320 [Proteobacteria bacterium]|nr:hypothetical protein [Pseudomonadota bacterium]
MPTAGSDRWVIPYGGATTAGPSALDRITLETTARRPLRLSDGWRFAEQPTAAHLIDRAAQFAFLRDQLKHFCDPWAPHQGRFLDAYFAFIAHQVARDAASLQARLAPFGDLYRVEDFGFAALRPLPRAHVPDGATSIAVDFAFWTGAELIALDLADTRRTRRQRAAAHARLGQAGAHVVELAAEAVTADGAGLATLLPAPLVRFCDGEALPASPFKAAALGDIVDADPRF